MATLVNIKERFTLFLTAVVVVVVLNSFNETEASRQFPDNEQLADLFDSRNLYRLMMAKHKQQQQQQQRLPFQKESIPSIKDQYFVPKQHQQQSKMNPFLSNNNIIPGYTSEQLDQMLDDYNSEYLDQINNNNNNADYANTLNSVDVFNTPEGWFDNPVMPNVKPVEDESPEGQLNRMLIDYLYQKYYKIPETQIEEENLQLPQQQQQQQRSSRKDSEQIEKRRQKIVIKDENNKLHEKNPLQSQQQQQQHLKSNNNNDSNQSKPILSKLTKPAVSRHPGQKEVAMLRPAEAKLKEEWPSELEESNLSEEEEDSLKTRTVRDVLASQLDNLKMEKPMNRQAIVAKTIDNQNSQQKSIINAKH